MGRAGLPYLSEISGLTQITQDAPFQVFLSADEDRPKAAIEGGYAARGSLFTYAIGRLVLWSKIVDVTKGDEALQAGAFSKLAIADPSAAPYGAAAIETMKKLGVYDALQAKIVQGSSIDNALPCWGPESGAGLHVPVRHLADVG